MVARQGAEAGEVEKRSVGHRAQGGGDGGGEVLAFRRLSERAGPLAQSEQGGVYFTRVIGAAERRE